MMKPGKGFGILTVFSMLVILFGIMGMVMAGKEDERAKQNRYYRILEQEYVGRTRRLLEDEGYDNCGINLTRVVYEDGNRQYRMLIHHRRLGRLSAEERTSLKERLQGMEFGQEECSFRYELEED